MTMLSHPSWKTAKGNLWFGTRNGLCKYNGKTFTHFTQKEGLSDNHIQSMLEDSHGNLWFGTRNGGVSMYNGKTFTHFTEKEGLSDNWVDLSWKIAMAISGSAS